MTTSQKIKDLFNPITNPSGGTTSALAKMYAGTSLFDPGPKSSFKPGDRSAGGLVQMMSGPVNNNLGSNLSKPAQFDLNIRSKNQPLPPAGGAPAPVVSRPGAAVPGASPAAPAAAPVGAAGAQAPAQASVPPQYMNPDGSMKTPEQVAAEITSTLKSTSEMPDIGRLAGNEFGGAGKSVEQLQTEAALINNARNDIAVGEADPYKVGAESGIAYTPAELAAIEKSYAGIYDPAITSAHAKLAAKEKEVEFQRKVVADAKAAEVEFGNDLKMLAEKHKYDLEAMKLDQAFEKSMIGYKAALDAQNLAATGGMTAYSDERSQRTVQSIDELMGQVNGWTTGFGSLLSSIPSTDAKNFNSQLNTLKAAIAFGELTAMREASKTGGALGNVSNIELNLLESALAGLDSAQAPEDFKVQLTKAKDSINRWRVAAGASALGTTPSTGSKVLVSATGEAFDASALTPEEYQEAIRDGYKPQ